MLIVFRSRRRSPGNAIGWTADEDSREFRGGFTPDDARHALGCVACRRFSTVCGVLLRSRREPAPDPGAARPQAPALHPALHARHRPPSSAARSSDCNGPGRIGRLSGDPARDLRRSCSSLEADGLCRHAYECRRGRGVVRRERRPERCSYHARLSRKSVLSGAVKSMPSWACALLVVIASSRF
jgi:hypothetical protein